MSKRQVESSASRAASRVRELREGAVGRITGVPGWVWLLLGGVVLLVVGFVAVRKVRAARAIDATDDALEE
jgi:hypothetical protein